MDVILTTAINYNYEKIRIFLNSLNNCYTGDLVIFSDRDYRLAHLNYNLIVIKISPTSVSKCCGAQINTANNFRYPLYYEYLKDQPYDNILLTDARDVYMQENALRKITDSILYVAVEENLIGNCAFNSDWIETIYGKKELDQLRHENIICSGTTMGRFDVIMEYLKYVSAEIMTFSPHLDSGDKHFVMDQGIHNYYCYQNQNKIKRYTNKDDLFLTLGYTEYVRLNKAGLVINHNNIVYPIIHQFDRINWLSNHLEYQLKDSIKKNNHLNLSFKNRIRKNIKEFRRYIATEEK